MRLPPSSLSQMWAHFIRTAYKRVSCTQSSDAHGREELRVNPALADCIRHSINGQHVRGDSVVNVVGLGIAYNVLECVLHDVFELLIHDRFLPEISLTILYPFEIGSGY